MIEARKCARCGSMYISDTEVCERCKQKDGADLYKLKGFLEKDYGEITQVELSIATGISNKNLTRFLQYEEFQGICTPKNNVSAANAVAEETNQTDVCTRLV